MLLRNSRKTECGAGQFLVRFAVRAAPFALPTITLGGLVYRSLEMRHAVGRPSSGQPDRIFCMHTALRKLQHNHTLTIEMFQDGNPHSLSGTKSQNATTSKARTSSAGKRSTALQKDLDGPSIITKLRRHLPSHDPPWVGVIR